MRPKYLEIEGLQSFREVQKIDFEALGETGLFGIFGPTGSGKSTVLDAITFALYGEVKRAERGTQGIINTNTNTVRVSFTFELAKDGKRRTFRVDRVYQRKKNSPNSCEAKIARLIEITDVGEIPICDKATEVTNNIKELLGLSHEDFTRAVVLPQNSFQEFLMLNNSERRKMLERIFYLEEYGKRLQEKLSRKMGRLKSRIDVLSGELKGYEDASHEALEEARKAMEEALAARQRVEDELKVLESKYHEAKEVWGLVQELSFVQEKEQQHLSLEEAVSEKRAYLEKAEKANSLLGMIQESKKLKERLQDTEKQLEEVLTILPGISAQLDETRRRYEDIKCQAATEQPQLAGQKARLEDALKLRQEAQLIQGKMSEVQTVLDKLEHELENKKGAMARETEGLEVLEQNLSKLKQELEPLKTNPEYRQRIQKGALLENEVEALKGAVKDAESKADSLKATIASLEQGLETIRKDMALSQKELDALNAEIARHEASKPEDKSSVFEYRDGLHVLHTVFDVLSLRKNELDGLEARHAKHKASLVQLTEQASTLNGDKEKASKVLEQCRLELEGLSKAMEQNAAWMLSRNLKAGEPCPVCGSEHHPRPAARGEDTDLGELERRAEEVKARLTQAEEAFRKAEKAALVADEQVKSLTAQMEQAQQELKDKTYQYIMEKQKLPEVLRELPLDHIRLELERMDAEAARRLQLAEAWEKQQGRYEEAFQKLNDILSKHRLDENSLMAQLKVNQESLEQLEKSLSETRQQYSEKQQKYSEFLHTHNITSVASELVRLAENDRKTDALQKQIEQVQTDISDKRRLMETWREELRRLQDDSIKARAEMDKLREQKEDKESRLKELVGDKSIEEEIRRIEDRLAMLQSIDKEYQAKVQDLEKQNHELTTNKSLLENQKNIYSESLKNDENRLNSALIEKGFRDVQEVENAILPPETQKALRDEITAYDQTGVNIKAQRDMVEQKLNARSITEEDWNRISLAYAEMAATKEQWVSDSEVARTHYENIKNKHEVWVKLSSDYQELKHKQELFEQIQKLLKANSFIDFIAEERLRYVAARASETLGVMTKYKYALELDTDAGFIIRDNANGGVHRMVNSLSGGETFLTSLALALALSEQIQLKGQSPLEFFFLDEGFGTLDNNLLDTVMDALERLSRKERVIGLISHVPELRIRLGRRLIVDPPTAQGEGSRVRIEKN